MKRLCASSVVVVVVALSFPEASFAENPIVQTIYTADPAPIVYDDTLYLYTGHDEDDAVGFKMIDYQCFSTTDMVNWTHHGAVLSVTAFDWASQTDNANAAQVIYRDGKFYYYVSVYDVRNGGIALGVAVSNSPTGPFVDALGHPLVTSQMTDFPGYATHGWRNLDPTVFVDDDEQAYLYWGNNACYWAKLNRDMISLGGPVNYIPLTTEAFGPDFEEAPWVYKRDGIYYMIYASSVPESIHYSTSTSPAGPWYYGGVVMDVFPNTSGNHPGIVDYKGNSYFFGFNLFLLHSETSTHYERRSVSVEQFTYDSEGSIPKLTWTTAGVPQIGSLNPYVRVEAETICWESGIETEACSEGGLNVGWIENGDYIKVKGVDFGTGATGFEARVASATGGGNIELRLDSVDGPRIGICGVSGTGGWQSWTTVSCGVSGAAGIHDLYLVFTGGSGYLFNVNWYRFI